MTAVLNQLGVDLAFTLMRQLDRDEYTVRIDSARAKRRDETYYTPDVFAVLTRLVLPNSVWRIV